MEGSRSVGTVYAGIFFEVSADIRLRARRKSYTKKTKNNFGYYSLINAHLGVLRTS